MESKAITLGGRSYTLRPLPMRPASRIRKEIGSLLETVQSQATALSASEVTDAGALVNLVVSLSQMALGSIDTIAEWLFAYSPELAEDREWIVDNAYDDEIVSAFLEMVKQLFPFGSLTSSLTGLVAQATLTNSRSRNGEDGRTN